MRSTNPSALIATSWMVLTLWLGPPSSAAAAECQAWQLLQKFNAIQDNGFSVVFDLSEVRDGKATGSAHYYADPDFRRVQGKADATFDGSTLTISVWWPQNKALGESKGHIDSGGNLAGVTQDLQRRGNAPNPEVYWRSKQKFKCAQTASDNRYCNAYANAAVDAAKEGLQLNCGFTGARWSADVGGHFNWCLSLAGDHTLPNSEKTARAKGLSDCRAKTAKGQIITQPPGADKLFKMRP
jgi:hypothetical protein